jgi:hypothetical protein
VLKSGHGSVVGNTKLWCESTVRNTNCDVNRGVETPGYVLEQAPPYHPPNRAYLKPAGLDATLRAVIGLELFCNA